MRNIFKQKFLALVLTIAALAVGHSTASAFTMTYTVSGGKGNSPTEFYAQFTDGSTLSNQVSWTYNSTAEISFNLRTNITLTLSETNKQLVIRDNATGDAIGGQGATTLTVSGNDHYYIYRVRLLTADGNVIQLDANGNAVTQGGVSECDYWNMTKSFSQTYTNGILFSKIEVSYDTAIPITDAVISGINDSYIVSNTAVTPTPTVTWHGTTLTKNTDYNLSYQNNTSAGTATVKATGKGKFSSNVTKNYTLVWATYSVRFNKNDDSATGTMGDQAFTYATAQNLTANAFTRTGYHLDRWTTNADGSGDSYTDGQEVTNLTATNGATVDLYAQWAPNTYTLRLHHNDGTDEYTDQSMTYDVAVNIQSITRTGYTFLNWTTNADGSGDSYTNGQSVSNLSATDGDIVHLYARWSAVSYFIHFYANGENDFTGTMSNEVLLYDTPQNLDLNRFTRTGYTFAGWNTKADGSGNSYTDGQEVLNLTSQGGTTVNLYAQWTINTYTVHFEANGGTGEMADQTFTYNTAQALTANAFTAPTGYLFAGWNSNANGTGNTYTNGQSVSNLTATNGATVDLYAQWTLITYNITYDLAGGRVATSNPATYTIETATFTLVNPTRTGYTFAGWTGSNGNTPQTTVTIPQGSMDDRSYTANWTANTYTVRFNKNSDGASGTMSDQAFTYGTAQNLTANDFTAPTGYLFAGWNTKADGKGTGYSNQQSVSNLTAENGAIVNLYAQWITPSGTCGDYGNENNVNWEVTDTNGDGTYETLTISGTGAMKNYGSSNQPWAAFKDVITTANIGDGVTRIGGNAFCQFTALTSVTIASSVTTIGNAVFFGCTNLTTVSGASGVTYVDSSAFDETAWENNLPDGLTSVGHVAYRFVGDGTSVNLDAATTQIYEYCFRDSKITSIVIPASVERIGDYAFDNSALQKMYVLRSGSNSTEITQLGNDAFSECSDDLVIVVPTAAYSTYSGHWYSYNLKLQRGYNITCNEGITATTTNNGPLVVEGETVTLSAPTGNVIISASYNDGSEDHEITPDNGVYSFEMPASNVTVSAVLNGPDYPYVVTTWADLKAKMALGGYIRLDADVTDPDKTASSGLNVPYNKVVTLDLNGHTIDRGMTERTESGYVIDVDGRLTLNDSGTGGTITGGYANSGGGVHVHSGHFTMNGGTISGNRARGGGSVYLCYNATFTMNGGTISGNTCDTNGNGGGVYLSGDGINTFTMNGGTISGNTCGTNGNGGGVYIVSGTIHVSGTPVITGNTNAAGKEENLYLKDNQNLINIDAPLSAGAFIGVTSAMALSTGGALIEIATGATDGDSQYFHSDINGLTIEAGQGEQAGKLLLTPPASTPWSELMDDLAADNDVTLTDDVTALECDGGYAEITNTVTLDLNGHNITANENSDHVIFINTNGNFTLTGSGTISGGTEGSVYVRNGTFNVSGNPVITGNTDSDGNALNVYLNKPNNKDQLKINVVGPLSADARIGVTAKTTIGDGDVVTITSGLSGNGSRDNFLSDNDNLAVVTTTDGEAALVKAYTVTIPDGVTISGLTPTAANTYKVGYTDMVTLSYSGEVPEGYRVCYTVKDASDNDVTVNKDNGEYTFIMPASDATVTAMFTYPWIGDGTADDPYQISNYAELKAFATVVNGTYGEANPNACAKLVDDIVCKNSSDYMEYATDWVPIGNASRPYTGTFDGKDNDGQIHTITGLSTPNNNSSDYVGLFGYIGSGGVVMNVFLDNATITGTNYVGVIVGRNNGTLTANYYIGCSVNTSATTNIGTGSGDCDGARGVHAITLGDNITASGESVNIGETTYYAASATITLSYSGEVPEGYRVCYTVKDASDNDVTVNKDNGEYTFIMPASNVTITATTKENLWETGSCTIATWEGNRKGAATFTFDDGAPSHVSDAGPLFNKYGYKATFFLVVNWNPDWSGFQGLADEGHEIGSHSNSHPQNMSGEEASSKQNINLKINQQPYGCITVAYPNGNVPSVSTVMQNYIAGRIFNGSWAGMPDIMGKDGPSNWARCPAIMTGAEGTIKITTDFTDRMQQAVNSEGWVMFATHGFKGKNNGNATYSPTDLGAIEGALEWAQEHDDDIWVTTFRNGVMYVKERKASSFTLTDEEKNRLTFTLTHSIADDVCPYDYPLTLCITVEQDEGYDYVITQNGKVIDDVTTDGTTFMFQAIPNGGNIVLTRTLRMDLADNADNTSVTNDHNGETVNVTLQGRTLYKDGAWNTLCLPFEVSIADGPLSGDGVVAMTIDADNSGVIGSTLTLNFDAVSPSGEQGVLIPAGTPFIIKWDNTGGTITNPVFSSVTINAEASTEVSFTGGKFVGTYASTTFENENKSILLLGAANKLYYPVSGARIGAQRAYFSLTPSPYPGGEGSVKEIVLNFGEEEETTGINVNVNTNNDAWYDLSGRKIANGQRPTAKGLYIHNGRKILK